MLTFTRGSMSPTGTRPRLPYGQARGSVGVTGALAASGRSRAVSGRGTSATFVTQTFCNVVLHFLSASLHIAWTVSVVNLDVKYKHVNCTDSSAAHHLPSFLMCVMIPGSTFSFSWTMPPAGHERCWDGKRKKYTFFVNTAGGNAATDKVSGQV